ncbi:type I restriction enzyme endonuclease domain-containing protein, partial [Thiolapillus sp.]|uniref:type I restriction enzyme endonuclease domain-containing protein n=1 Tax=Thiolapillus sp. TaxID=2017437 RepID=UPI003AF80BD5
LTQEEIAFYDALAENESAIEAMGDEQLRVIAHELLTNVKRALPQMEWVDYRNPL